MTITQAVVYQRNANPRPCATTGITRGVRHTFDIDSTQIRHTIDIDYVSSTVSFDLAFAAMNSKVMGAVAYS